ncbi:hypothetical protein VTN77DRAFT_4943 [Rasamsonia byssochlamydoides]|uniref:uncharacterized protein n=1 Tax=Rasamsonia byssochlamydoides TaxID=89139 RepID=UPI003741FC7D
MVSDECPIIGMEFFYTDKNSAKKRHHGTNFSVNLDQFSRAPTHSDFSKRKWRPKLRPQLQEGNIITGFVATQTEKGRYFARLGLKGKPPSGDPGATPRCKENEDHAHYLSENQNQYDKDFALYIHDGRHGVAALQQNWNVMTSQS